MHFPGGRLDAAIPKKGTYPNGTKGKIMKRILGLTTAALLSASMLGAPAFAQANLDHPGGADADPEIMTTPQAPAPEMMPPEATTPMPDIDTGTTAAIGGSFDGALTAISGTSTSAQSIASMPQVESVNVVRVSELEGSDPALVEQTVSQNEAGIEELRAAISANPSFSQELQAAGVDASSVVGAQVEADGGVTVYVL